MPLVYLYDLYLAMSVGKGNMSCDYVRKVEYLSLAINLCINLLCNANQYISFFCRQYVPAGPIAFNSYYLLFKKKHIEF